MFSGICPRSVTLVPSSMYRVPKFKNSEKMVIVAYLAVALIDMLRIRRIPMTEALKNVE